MTTALLIIDMQHFFLDMTTNALPKILTLIDHFKSKSLTIIFTQHGHSKEELTPPFKNQIVKKWGPGGSLATGSRDWEFITEIGKEAKGGIVVAKNTYDSFINTNLSQILEDKHISRLVVCGVMTDCCCDTTARSSFNRGYDTWMVKDACGSANERQHEAGLRGFEFGYGPLKTTKEVLEDVG